VAQDRAKVWGFDISDVEPLGTATEDLSR